MDLACGYRAKNGIKSKQNGLNGVGIGSSSNILLTIKLPGIGALRIMSRSLFLVMVLVTLPSIVSILRGSSVGSVYEPDIVGFDVNDTKMLPNLFRDLVEEGLLKKGHRGLIVSSDLVGDGIQEFDTLNVNGIYMVVEVDLNDNNKKSVIPNEEFDFVFISSFQNANAIDRILKTGGIVVSQLRNNPSNELQKSANYKLVYLRQFDYTMVAMRKIGSINSLTSSSPKQTFCGITSQPKKAAVRGLEDALLEPPRTALAKSINGSRKMNFLPDLLKDSLEKYPRHIFISVGESGVGEWFHDNYPMRNQEFEVYNMEIEMYDPERSNKVVPPYRGLSDWLRNHVREDDYVVMKAEAMVVEQMIEEKTICLVDELFLECKNQREDGDKENSSKRAYWQCLALFGKLRDDGVAVHQWWS